MNRLSRRHFLTAAAVAAPLAAIPLRAPAAAGGPRALTFTHLHTGERLSLEYFRNGAYLPEAMQAVNHLLRDFRNGAVGNMDPALLDLLHGLHQATGSQAPFQIISGYRSPATNEALHRRSAGVATRSLHLKGMAIDIRLADVQLEHLRDAALSLRRGGVGYYAGSNFVHIDTGRVRAW
ncbi:DUF882 domain-containing protein [Piscinibacter sp.]|uniref:DUF882 domain-containing protein n=1 Tax=Piscinibacter sp. TaxID=1903157 RepID=UPI002BAF2C46|nr:DUF882 domain-containing protein [Albitalea sp.]HUG23741.1 DUF882 domain-containing protein [Albitalea sp.]